MSADPTVYLVRIGPLIVQVYATEALARRHVELMSTTKVEALRRMGIDPQKIRVEPQTVHSEMQYNCVFGSLKEPARMAG